MKYRRFGRTNLRMPVFSCGGMRYQHKWQDISASDIPQNGQANLEATIHRSLELGIHHIETARGYGSSEMQLGFLLPKLPRDKLIIQTKIAPDPDPKKFLEAFAKSMNYLKLDHVDLLGIHGINNADLLHQTLRKGGCLAAARKLQKEGRVRFIGFSTHATCHVILQGIDSGEFDYVNLHWYFVNDLNWPAVEAAARQDMGVFIISPNDKGGKLYDPPQKLATLCHPLSPMAFNDLYCLARPQIHTLSLGASKPSDFDEHIRSLDYYDRIPEIITPIEKRLRDEMEKILGADWCRYWNENLPEYFQEPSQVNVIEILRLWMHAKSLDLVEWGKMRYNLLGGNGGHWFPGEMASKMDETRLAPLLKKNRFAERIPNILREAHTLFFTTPQKRLSQN